MEPTDRSPVASLLPIRGRASERRGLERGPSARRYYGGDAPISMLTLQAVQTASRKDAYTPEVARIPRSASDASVYPDPTPSDYGRYCGGDVLLPYSASCSGEAASGRASTLTFR